MFIPFGVFSAGAGTSFASDYELIETISISNNSTVNFFFNSIPQDYKHLQIRYAARTTYPSSPYTPSIYVNGYNAGKTGATHLLEGNTSTVISASYSSVTYIDMGAVATGASPTNAFGAGVIDILDYTNTSKNKTVKTLSGMVESGSSSRVRLSSGFHIMTTAVSSLEFSTNSGSYFWTSGSRFSLYGVRG